MPRFVDRRKSFRGGDRRRYPRLSFELFGCYTSHATGIFFERGNFSLRGMYLPCHFPDLVGTRGTVRLSLPGQNEMLKLPVEVVWADRDEDRGMGLRFDGPD
ncbi:MAG: PilZ domain-containing protein, partial [Deltaproteobacteria bacterium]